MSKRTSTVRDLRHNCRCYLPLNHHLNRRLNGRLDCHQGRHRNQHHERHPERHRLCQLNNAPNPDLKASSTTTTATSKMKTISHFTPHWINPEQGSHGSNLEQRSHQNQLEQGSIRHSNISKSFYTPKKKASVNTDEPDQ